MGASGPDFLTKIFQKNFFENRGAFIFKSKNSGKKIFEKG